MKRSMTIIGVSLVTAFAPASVLALPISGLEVTVSAVIHDLGGIGTADGRIEQEAAAGPLAAELANGAVLAYSAPGFPDWGLEATLFQTARARADYGTNAAAVKSGLAAVSGQDRGDFPSGRLIDLELRSSLAPEMHAFSDWVDTFVINGGTGLGTATVNVELGGRVQSAYGENGTAFYDESGGTFEEFGTTGVGFLNYRMRIRYDEPPVDFGSDGPPSVVRFEEDFGNQQSNHSPLPAFAADVGDPTDLLTGEFIFEYGTPFALMSSLSLTGHRQIDMDYSHTATLSLFDLPEGASLSSGSGHLYAVSAGQPAAVPEPSTVWLLGYGLLALIGFRRKDHVIRHV